MTIARGLESEKLEKWLNNVLYHDFDLIFKDDSSYQDFFFLLEGFGYIKNNNEPGLQQLMSKQPCDEELAKVNHESVNGAKNEKEDDGDMKSPVDEEGPRGPQRYSNNLWNSVCLGNSIGTAYGFFEAFPSDSSTENC
ncbi:hypothetical protein GCK72_022572 [Caenorhabditis remanei]|uniref:Uncharacterized protein n=1 Tax=Caenorhabditis remanei TaxID=31234 RepID=A0A6A5FU26_CAERE|nr:hypothetical protein GCK72_022572 [Caenorhabditis remanei]KAF1746120.1 hypothetical protein GCK72_022572 [Caenorhabditis remanei]